MTTEGEFFFRDGPRGRQGGWVSDYLAERAGQVVDRVDAIDRDTFLRTADEAIVKMVAAALRIEPLVLDLEHQSMRTEETRIDVSRDPNRAAYYFDPGQPALMPATNYVFIVPYSGDSALWSRTPSSYSAVYPRGILQGGQVEFVFGEPVDVDPRVVKDKLDSELGLANQYLDSQRKEVDNYNDRLHDNILPVVQSRRAQLDKHQQLADSLGIPLTTAATPATQKATSAVRARDRWDVFISYAGEDRNAAAAPLAHALEDQNLRVWYDDFELSLGDSLRRRIDDGLAKSRYGVVVLSPSFFKKDWPQRELDGLVQREDNGKKVILPVWYELDRDYVVQRSPMLADRVAAKWSDGLDSIVKDVLRVVSPSSVRKV